MSSKYAPTNDDIDALIFVLRRAGNQVRRMREDGDPALEQYPDIAEYPEEFDGYVEALTLHKNGEVYSAALDPMMNLSKWLSGRPSSLDAFYTPKFESVHSREEIEKMVRTLKAVREFFLFPAVAATEDPEQLATFMEDNDSARKSLEEYLATGRTSIESDPYGFAKDWLIGFESPMDILTEHPSWQA